MIDFRAVAKNSYGDHFQFFFKNENWNGAKEAAEKKLLEIVANDPLHQKYGPWVVDSFDIGL